MGTFFLRKEKIKGELGGQPDFPWSVPGALCLASTRPSAWGKRLLPVWAREMDTPRDRDIRANLEAAASWHRMRLE